MGTFSTRSSLYRHGAGPTVGSLGLAAVGRFSNLNQFRIKVDDSMRDTKNEVMQKGTIWKLMFE
jgi:hypothetical protein